MIDVHISFVLDKSGSMQHLAQSTIEGFNQYLKDQQDQEGNAWMSLTLFDTFIDPRFVAWNVKDIPKMKPTGTNAYQASGGTALLDAVGVAIKGAEKWQENNKWFDGQMLVVVQTDGDENSSRQFVRSQVKDLIEYKKGQGWQFIFLGTGEASWLEGADFAQSIGWGSTINYASNAHDHNLAYNTVSASTSAVRGSATVAAAASAFVPDQSWNSANPGVHVNPDNPNQDLDINGNPIGAQPLNREARRKAVASKKRRETKLP